MRAGQLMMLMTPDAATPNNGAPPAFAGYTYDYIENWEGYSAGDGWTELNPAYASSSGSFLPVLATDAGGPGGLVLTPDGLVSSVVYIDRDDIRTALAGGGTVVEFHTSFRRPNADINVKHGLGYFGAATFNFWGVASKYNSSGPRHDLVYMNNASLSTGGSLLLANTTNTICHARIQYDYSGTPTMRIKAWADGNSEPGSWDADVAMSGTPGTFPTRCPLMCYRADLSSAGGVLWYGVRIDP